ncbi:glycosyltransferase family 4 protein [Aurantiacibacter poecillastricola]|uniref:glycosyltransferase family 4 protein n=1 Tax=Aurantiacibacter poecillastricola TaxID=3064385 RepID=UPI00273F6CDE|nr:glycosyltransferase family 4 protein [Aurantiacibacter sp. 219JJ12-13]MDP5260002.1 glycosyltransferase family 4 protein [Aurantiacibacter sp. 219JJ12-13]
MRIAFVLAGLGAGGAEKVVSLLCGELLERGHEVSVIAFDRPEDPIYHAFPGAVRLHRLGVARGGGALLKGLGANVSRARALRQAFKALKPDIVASFLTKINVLSVLASAGLDHRVVISERNNPSAQKANPLWNKAWTIAARRADAVILQSEGIREVYPSDISGRAIVIPNPVELPQLQPSKADTKVIAGVGRLTQQKGFDRLIDAYAMIAADFPDWRLAIWGEGPLRDELERQAAASGFADRISLPGNSSTPASWIEDTAIYALSSRYEGFPNVLLEAMLAGLPVAAFACDYGPAEIINDGENGMLVADQDTGRLAAALRALMEDAELRHRFGSNASQRARDFSLPRIAAKWESVFESFRPHGALESDGASSFTAAPQGD